MKSLIEQYRLAPHPEGGYYREVYRSVQQVQSDRAGAARSAATHIYFLLTAGDMSRLHRVCHDELWHIYQGHPLRLILFDGSCVQEVRIGPGCESPSAVVPGGIWQAAASTGDYTLSGCTVAPGFEFTDFSFLADDPQALKVFQSLDTGLASFI